MRPETPRVRVEQTVERIVRQMRALRVERLAPTQRLVLQWTRSVRQWLGERTGLAERLRPSLAARQEMTMNVAPLGQRPDPPRQSQSRGMRI